MANKPPDEITRLIELLNANNSDDAADKGEFVSLQLINAIEEKDESVTQIIEALKNSVKQININGIQFEKNNIKKDNRNISITHFFIDF